MCAEALGCSGVLCAVTRLSDELRRETSFLTMRCLHFGRTVLRYIVHWDANVVRVVFGMIDDHRILEVYWIGLPCVDLRSIDMQ